VTTGQLQVFKIETVLLKVNISFDIFFMVSRVTVKSFFMEQWNGK